MSWVRGDTHSPTQQEGGKEGGARFFWQAKPPPALLPAPCRLHSFLAWALGAGRMADGVPFLFLSLPFPCIPPILIIPRPPGSSFSLLDRAW